LAETVEEVGCEAGIVPRRRLAYYLDMPRQPAPTAVPIASYIGQSIRLLAICDDCLNVAALDPVSWFDSMARPSPRRT